MKLAHRCIMYAFCNKRAGAAVQHYESNLFIEYAFTSVLTK